MMENARRRLVSVAASRARHAEPMRRLDFFESSTAHRAFASSSASSSDAGADSRARMSSMMEFASKPTATVRGKAREAREAVSRWRAEASARARESSERVIGKRATEFLWTASTLNPVVVKRAIEQRAVSAVATHWRAVEAFSAVACGTAMWRGARAFKKDVMGVPCDSVLFDVAYGDGSMLGGSLLLAGAGAYALRQRWKLDIDHCVTMAMKRLDGHSGVRELLGGPVTASAARVVVTSGGGLALFKRTTSRFFGAVTLPVSVDSKWAHVVFELRGTRKRGVVSFGARKWGGEYALPILSLELDSRNGETYRLFLEGGSSEFEASVLPSLRAPLEATTINEEFKRTKTLADERAAATAAALVAERRAASSPKPLDEGGGMYAHERVMDAFGKTMHFLRTSVARYAKASKN